MPAVSVRAPRCLEAQDDRSSGRCESNLRPKYCAVLQMLTIFGRYCRADSRGQPTERLLRNGGSARDGHRLHRWTSAREKAATEIQTNLSPLIPCHHRAPITRATEESG